MSMFKGTLLITGGTGSFGHTVLKHFLNKDIGQICIFSRNSLLLTKNYMKRLLNSMVVGGIV